MISDRRYSVGFPHEFVAVASVAVRFAGTAGRLVAVDHDAGASRKYFGEVAGEVSALAGSDSPGWESRPVDRDIRSSARCAP